MASNTDLEGIPHGWRDDAGQLLRLAAPDGRTVAWFAPTFGANCVGFAARGDTGWHQVFHGEGPAALRARPSRFGLPILCPFPGDLPAGRYAWRGRDYRLPGNAPTGGGFLHGFAHTRPWTVLDHSATTVTAELLTADALRPEEWAGYPFDLSLRLRLTVAAASLLVELTATNRGAVGAPVGLGLHPYIDPALFGGDRAQARVRLPGRLERRPAVAGDPPLRPASGSLVMAAPLGSHALVGRADLGDDPVVTLEGPDGHPRIALRLLAGVREVVAFCPAEHPSISIEPLSVPLSAARHPEGHPDGPMGLEPGQVRRLVVAIDYWETVQIQGRQ